MLIKCKKSIVSASVHRKRPFGKCAIHWNKVMCIIEYWTVSATTTTCMKRTWATFNFQMSLSLQNSTDFRNSFSTWNRSSSVNVEDHFLIVKIQIKRRIFIHEPTLSQVFRRSFASLNKKDCFNFLEFWFSKKIRCLMSSLIILE